MFSKVTFMNVSKLKTFHRCMSSVPYVEFLNNNAKLLFKQAAYDSEKCKYAQVGLRQDHNLPSVIEKIESTKDEILQDDIEIIEMGQNNSILDMDIYSSEDIHLFLKSRVENHCTIYNSDYPPTLQNNLKVWYENCIQMHTWLQKQDQKSDQYGENVQEKIKSFNIDFNPLIKDLEECNIGLSFKDLFGVIIGLKTWPPSKTINAGEEEKESFSNLVTMLEVLSIERFKGKNVMHENHITDAWRKLALMKAWSDIGWGRCGKGRNPHVINYVFYINADRKLNMVCKQGI